MSEQGAFTRSRGGYSMAIRREERELIGRLLDELRGLLSDPDGNAAAMRLFPVVHPDDPEQEAEYQRLMRDELIASKLAGIDVVKEVLDGDTRRVTFTEDQLVAFMQSVNSLRLVLGTILDVSEDDELGDAAGEHVAEYQLYAYLSWILDSAVHALSHR